MSYLFLIPGKRRVRVKAWIKELNISDVVVDMSAISYVGPPSGKTLDALLNGRFRYFLLSRIYNQPFLAWTQSYGPFSSSIIKYIARQDLKRLNIVFCRGQNSLEAVQALVPEISSCSFPDVAITLDYDKDKGRKYIEKLINMAATDKIITISPSSVLFSKTKKNENDELNNHIRQITIICKTLQKKGYTILLLPHSLRRNNKVVSYCDLMVSQIIYKNLVNGSVAIVTEDLSPIELKSIISNAYFHIGARYHSLVAALSTGVPTIALSWHPKYEDLLIQYGMKEYVYESNKIEPGLNQLFTFIGCIEKNRDSLSNTIQKKHRKLLKCANKNAELFTNEIKKITMK